MVWKEGVPTLRMEVILSATCDLDLPIWHLFFDLPGIMNDLNFLSVGPHFSEVLAGRFPAFSVGFEIGDQSFDWMYYLADCIYPQVQDLLQVVLQPHCDESQVIFGLQESVRKCVERVFGVLLSISAYRLLRASLEQRRHAHDNESVLHYLQHGRGEKKSALRRQWEWWAAGHDDERRKRDCFCPSQSCCASVAC